jgi:hypothetical protein
MDNKENRQFYWEVKQFLQNSNNVSVEKMAPKPSMVDAIKSIVETSKPPAPKAIDNSIVGGIGQVIQSTESSKAGYKAQSHAYTTNNISNPFYLSEGYWDDFMKGLAEVGEFGTNVFGKGQGAGKYGAMLPMTADQARQNASLRRARQALNLNSDQLNLQQTANPGLVNQSDVSNLLSQKTTSGVSLLGDADRQKATNLLGQLSDQEDQNQKNNTPAIAGVDTEGPPSPAIAGVDTEGPPSSLSGSQTSSGSLGLSSPSFVKDVSDKAKGLLDSMNAKKSTPTPSTPTPSTPIKSSPGGLATYGSVQRTPEQIAADKAKATANKKAQLERSIAYFETLHSQKQGSSRPEHNVRRVAHMTKLQQQLKALG